MRLLSILLTLFWFLPAFAETKTYDVKGMHCGGCVAMIKSKVCKMPGVDACHVEMNKVVLTGSHLDDQVVSSTVASAGEYSVTKISSSEPASANPETANETAVKTKTTKSTKKSSN